MKLAGKAKMMRIHFGEDDRWHGKPLYQAIVERCREKGMAGATVYRGIQGYGASTIVHRRHLLSFSADNPVMVSIIDTAEKVDGFLPVIDEMVTEGLIAISDVEVIKYGVEAARPGDGSEDKPGSTKPKPKSGSSNADLQEPQSK